MSQGPNQKRARAALVLVVMAVVAVVLAGGSILLQRATIGQPVITGKFLPEIAADMPQVRTIKIETKNDTYNLVRRGTKWVMPERGDYPVSEAAMSGLAKGLSELTYKDKRTSDPTQFARLGVDRPSDESDGTMITIKGGSGQIIDSFHIGQKGEVMFGRLAGMNDVFELGGKLPELRGAAAWLDLKVVDMNPETIASVSGQLQGEGRYDIVRRPDGGFAPVGGVANVTATTAAIALTKWAPIDVIAASALTTDPIASHVTTLKSGVAVSVTAYEEEARNWVVLSAEATGAEGIETATTINQRTDGWAFELSDTDFADLTFKRAAIIGGPS
jgi:Domain of unknown function (DUF4340)